MNRIIKFRAWDTSGEKSYMLGGYELSDAIFNHKDVRSLPLMQFTGLHDKNGKEIYEGDMVKHFESEGYGVVKFLSCSFMVEWIGQDCYSDLLGWYNFKRGAASKPEDYEVIGNVFENPELLNKETMNQKIKEILEKHIDIDQLLPDYYHEDLNNALVEICEEQKKECAERFNNKGLSNKVINDIINEIIIDSKNIAQ